MPGSQGTGGRSKMVRSSAMWCDLVKFDTGEVVASAPGEELLETVSLGARRRRTGIVGMCGGLRGLGWDLNDGFQGFHKVKGVYGCPWVSAGVRGAAAQSLEIRP